MLFWLKILIHQVGGGRGEERGNQKKPFSPFSNKSLEEIQSGCQTNFWTISPIARETFFLSALFIDPKKNGKRVLLVSASTLFPSSKKVEFFFSIWKPNIFAPKLAKCRPLCPCFRKKHENLCRGRKIFVGCLAKKNPEGSDNFP